MFTLLKGGVRKSRPRIMQFTEEKMLTVYFTEYGAHAGELAESLYPLLSPERRRKASLLTHPGRRAESVLAGRLFEKYASRMSGVSPVDFTYKYGENGKPSLSFPDGFPAFSIAHTDGAACVAFSGGAFPCGCDIEPAAREFSGAAGAKAIASRFFSPGEAALLEDAPKELFLKVFTAKEAHAKMTGRGIFEEISLDIIKSADPLLFDAGDGSSFFRTVYKGYVISLCVGGECGTVLKGPEAFPGPVVFAEIDAATLAFF